VILLEEVGTWGKRGRKHKESVVKKTFKEETRVQ